MQLHKLTVGPIVGETKQNRVRIWGRGEAHVKFESLAAAFGLGTTIAPYLRANIIGPSAVPITESSPYTNFGNPKYGQPRDIALPILAVGGVLGFEGLFFGDGSRFQEISCCGSFGRTSTRLQE